MNWKKPLKTDNFAEPSPMQDIQASHHSNINEGTKPQCKGLSSKGRQTKPEIQSSIEKEPELLCIGVMTGNSLDGIDTVLTLFKGDSSITDYSSHFRTLDKPLYNAIRYLQKVVQAQSGNMDEVACNFQTDYEGVMIGLEELIRIFTLEVSKTIHELIGQALLNPEINEYIRDFGIDIIGFHGQTCDHRPPSAIGTFDPKQVYTVQIGDGQLLADTLGISVICDFRSDDLMNGGEAAPLAPFHHYHLANHFKSLNYFPAIICNGGNTGNLTLILQQDSNQKLDNNSKDIDCQPNAYGWDTGPFNHYTDALIRKNTHLSYDLNGLIGAQGHVISSLLESLFNQSTSIGKNNFNFLTQPPPKSADPNMYTWLADLDNEQFALADRVRTCEYFAAYSFFFSLGLTPDTAKLPYKFALCGGGWQNPVVMQYFIEFVTTPYFTRELNQLELSRLPILHEHMHIFQSIANRLRQDNSKPEIHLTDDLGLSSQNMEARIWADMARCRVTNIPFSIKTTTGVNKPTVGGIIYCPYKDLNTVSANTLKAMNQAKLKPDNEFILEQKSIPAQWSRASAGWQLDV